MSEKKLGVLPPNYKYDDTINYSTLHHWVTRKLGKPVRCEHCGQVKDWMQWASKSHEYKRDVSDWLSLCIPCHQLYDKDRGDIKELYDKDYRKKS